MALYRKTTLTEASRYAPGMEDGWTLLWSGDLFTHEKRETREAAQAYFDSMFRNPDEPHTGEPEPKVVAVIHTKEGLHVVAEGDWIITGPHGERRVIKADIFAATYDLAALPVEGATDRVDAAACAIWSELCPGLVMGDEDRPHYEAAARAALAAEVDEAPGFDRAQAAAAASKIYDYADLNVTMFDACCDETPKGATDIYNAAKALHELLPVDPR